MKKILIITISLALVLFGPLDGWKEQATLKPAVDFVKREIEEIRFVQEFKTLFDIE